MQLAVTTRAESLRLRLSGDAYHWHWHQNLVGRCQPNVAAPINAKLPRLLTTQAQCKKDAAFGRANGAGDSTSSFSLAIDVLKRHNEIVGVLHCFPNVSWHD